MKRNFTKETRRNTKDLKAILTKTGVFTVAAVTVSGMAAGMAPVAYADEAVPETAAAQTSVPGSVAEAEAAAQEASAAKTAAEAAEQAAAEEYAQAQADAEAAQAAVDTAYENAENAFYEAQQNAAEADASAQAAVDMAAQNAAEAQNAVTETNNAYDTASAEYAAAEIAFDQTVADCPFTETDIADKENAVSAAEKAETDALDAVGQASETVNTAETNLTNAEQVKQDAESAVSQASAAYADADAAVQTAQDAADRAAADLQNTQDLIDGKIDITQSNAYQEKQAAQQNVTDAQNAVDTAQTDVNNASAAYQQAQGITAQAGAARDAAQVVYVIKRDDADQAAQGKTDAEQAEAEALAGRTQAESEAAQEAEHVAAAEAGKTEADAAVENAVAAQTSAHAAVTDAENALATVSETANAQVDADLAEANLVVIANREAYEQTQAQLADADVKYKLGMLGFVDWMMTKDGLTKLQLQDLQAAKDAINAGLTEDMSTYATVNGCLPAGRNNMVLTLNDRYESTSIENIEKSLTIMKRINVLRATDDNFTGDLARNPSGTNFFMMVASEKSAMRGAEILDHSRFDGDCECLAWGYTDPTAGWYSKEKARFDQAKANLGITTITDEEQLWAIEEEAYRNGWITGHYTGLLWAKDQAMGVGYTDYNRTFCYNAESADSMLYDRRDNGKHIYTVEEFEALFNEYKQTIDKTACEAAVANAKTALEESEATAQAIEDSRAVVVNAATESALNTLAEKQAAAQAADNGVTDATARAAAAAVALDEARTNKAAADERLAAAAQAYEEATADADAARLAADAADAALAEALEEVNSTMSAYEEAVTAEEEARADLDDKQSILDTAEADLVTAQNAYDAASDRLANLMSEETLQAKQDNKDAADQALNDAIDIRNGKEEVLQQAEQDLADAETAVQDAQGAVDAAKADLSAAESAYAQAQQNTASAKQSLQDVLDAYAPVTEAAENKNAALDNMNDAMEEAETAAGLYEAAEQALADAQSEKEISSDLLRRAMGLSFEDALENPVEDEAFAYLNDYIDRIDTAEDKYAAAQDLLGVLKKQLNTAEMKASIARTEYYAAMADLMLTQSMNAEKTENTRSSVSKPESKIMRLEVLEPVATKVGHNPTDPSTEPAPEEQVPADEDAVAMPGQMEYVPEIRYLAGDNGEEVAAIQEGLIRLGFLNDKADGQYGPLTENAVRDFQKTYGLEITGVMDAQTRELLDVIISSVADEDPGDAAETIMFHDITVKKNPEGLYYVAPGTVSEESLEAAEEELHAIIDAHDKGETITGNDTLLFGKEDTVSDESLMEARKAYTAIRYAFIRS